MVKTKVYLSLDDLHKLYGISPATVAAIKNKRRKRRAKKLSKINNTTMGAPKSSSAHMVGSSQSLAIDVEALRKAKIEKHIKDINDENKNITNKLLIAAAPAQTTQQNQNMFQLMNGINSGALKTKTTHNSITITDPTLNNKPGAKLGVRRKEASPFMTTSSNTVNKKDNTGIAPAGLSSSSFKATAPPNNTLLSAASNSINTITGAATAIAYVDTLNSDGVVAGGTGSDNFINLDGADQQAAADAAAQKIIDDATQQAIDDAAAKQLVDDAAQQLVDDTAAAQQQAIDDAAAQQATVNAKATATAAPKRGYMDIDKDELQTIAIANNISLKNIKGQLKARQTLFKELQELNLL
jgi:hypothetical protein